jgi:hypothetical protein
MFWSRQFFDFGAAMALEQTLIWVKAMTKSRA